MRYRPSFGRFVEIGVAMSHLPTEKNGWPFERLQSKPHEHMRGENIEEYGDYLWSKDTKRRMIN